MNKLYKSTVSSTTTALLTEWNLMMMMHIKMYINCRYDDTFWQN